uniref:CSON006843 protein n=1 Tax=Culicoides sonorensis TaxID=179676 RepID=A0A336LA42_CULSO
MSTHSLMPQTVYFTFTLLTYVIGGLFIQTTNSLVNLGKLSSLVFPVIALLEISKYIIIQKWYQLPGNNLTSAFHNKSSNVNTNITLVNRIKDFIKSVLLLLVAGVIFAFIAIILGAPLFNNYEETISLSLVLTVLTVLPLQLFLGSRYTIISMLINKLELGKLVAEEYLSFLQHAGIGAVLGAWTASVVMPLDWERPWQVYPIPNIVGAVGGHLLGCTFSIMQSVLLGATAELKKKSLL